MWGRLSASLKSHVEPAVRRLNLRLGALVVLFLLVLLGYVFVHPAPSGDQSRISYLESVVKCPTCISVSTKDANTASAFALRNYISDMVHQGVSNAQILTQLTTIYGESILLFPQANKGGDVLVGLGLIAAILLPGGGFVYYRLRRNTDATKFAVAEPNGQTSDATNTGFNSFELAQLARFEQVASTTSNDAHHIPVRGWAIFTRLTFGQRLLMMFGSLTLMVGIAFLLFGALNSQRQSLANGASVTSEIQNAQSLAAAGNDVLALTDLGGVLAQDPKNATALAWNGWLLRQAGDKTKSSSLIKTGLIQMEASVALDPNYYYSRVFLGIALFEDQGNAIGAVKQFDAYFRLAPPNSLTNQVINTIRAAYQKIGKPVPVAR